MSECYMNEHAHVRNSVLTKHQAIRMGNSAAFPKQVNRHLAIAGAATNQQLALSRMLGNKEKGLPGDMPMAYDVVLMGTNNRRLNPNHKVAQNPKRVHLIDNRKGMRGCLITHRICEAIEELYEKYGNVRFTINCGNEVQEIRHENGSFRSLFITQLAYDPELDGGSADPHGYKIEDEEEKTRLRLARQAENHRDPDRLVKRGLRKEASHE